MSAGMTRAWLPAGEKELERVPSTTGVYEIRREDGTVLDIGYAGSREPFGLTSRLRTVLGDAGWDGLQFRYESHVQYQTRYMELVLLHRAQHDGATPEGVANRPIAVPGRLSPG